jgi:hypothetical protein
MQPGFFCGPLSPPRGKLWARYNILQFPSLRHY